MVSQVQTVVSQGTDSGELDRDSGESGTDSGESRHRQW